MSTWRILILMLLLPLSGALADELAGQASVFDGDTLEIHGVRVRLWGIDAPESTQLCRAKTVFCIAVAR
jgi:endonuclease YncB( thermonuclease family)